MNWFFKAYIIYCGLLAMSHAVKADTGATSAESSVEHGHGD